MTCSACGSPRVSIWSRTSTSSSAQLGRDPLVGDLEDVGSRLAELGEQLGQAAGEVGDADPQEQVAAGGRHAVPDHLAEQQRVDVAAGEHRHRRRS